MTLDPPPAAGNNYGNQGNQGNNYGNQGNNYGSQIPQSNSNLIYPSSPPKDPLLTGLLSGCCIAGLGQIVLGQVTKGIVLIIVAILLAAATAGISAIFMFPLMGIDAYLVAKKLKNGNAVTQWECF
jgi:TM2 domain-containing membrane protein YozV